MRVGSSAVQDELATWNPPSGSQSPHLLVNALTWVPRAMAPRGRAEDDCPRPASTQSLPPGGPWGRRPGQPRA